MEKKIYRIPQRLDREFQLAGFTVWQLMLFIAASILGLWTAAAGYPQALIVPSVLFVLHVRVGGDGRSVKEILKIRIRYLKKEQSYGMQDCERKRQKK